MIFFLNMNMGMISFSCCILNPPIETTFKFLFYPYLKDEDEEQARMVRLHLLRIGNDILNLEINVFLA